MGGLCTEKKKKCKKGEMGKRGKAEYEKIT